MLRHLSIRDFAIVPSLALDIPAGFIAITGETGAGKSILVDAIGLLLGDRASSESVRHGAERAELSATFDLEPDGAAAAWLQDLDLDTEDECLLRRSIGANGRSRAWINGTPITVSQLQELGRLLIELHGQNQHLQLSRAPEQLALLDAGEQHAGELAELSKHFEAWRKASDELDRLLSDTEQGGNDLDYLRFQLQELEGLELEPAAIEKLEADHRVLAKAGELQTAIGSALTDLKGESSGVEVALARAVAELQQVSEFDSGLAESIGMLEEALINCQEAALVLSRAMERADQDPQRLAEAESQLATLHDLARKHRMAANELAEFRDQLRERLHALENLEGTRASLEQKVAEGLANYRKSAKRLGKKRMARARELASAVTSRMHELGMPGGEFQISVIHEPKSPPSARGDDRVELLVTTNPGTPAAPLSRVASGGELSRISLALRVAAQGGGAGTQIFDEVDAGIGGETAHAVGQTLRSIATGSDSGYQALCVTHLAQVAVCADQHFRVSKLAGDASTRVDADLLSESERVDEIARMLGGQVTEQSRGHAAELLSAAKAAA